MWWFAARLNADAVFAGSQLWSLPYPMTAVRASEPPPPPLGLFVDSGPDEQADRVVVMAVAALSAPVYLRKDRRCSAGSGVASLTVPPCEDPQKDLMFRGAIEWR